jgi:hypothetical protein
MLWWPGMLLLPNIRNDNLAASIPLFGIGMPRRVLPFTTNSFPSHLLVLQHQRQFFILLI